MKHDGELGIREDLRGLSSLRSVARIEAVVYDREGVWAITAEIPYDGTVLLARCLSKDAAASVVPGDHLTSPSRRLASSAAIAAAA